MHIILAVISTAAIWTFMVAKRMTIYYFYSLFVERLPPPVATSGKLYAYVYACLQVTAANTRRTQDAVATQTTLVPPSTSPKP